LGDNVAKTTFFQFNIDFSGLGIADGMPKAYSRVQRFYSQCLCTSLGKPLSHLPPHCKTRVFDFQFL